MIINFIIALYLRWRGWRPVVLKGTRYYSLKLETKTVYCLLLSDAVYVDSLRKGRSKADLEAVVEAEVEGINKQRRNRP